MLENFSWIDWTALSGVTVTFFAFLGKIVTALKVGSNAAKTFATSKVNNAQDALNNKIDEIQLIAENKINLLEAKINAYEQRLQQQEQQILDYQNRLRSMLENA